MVLPLGKKRWRLDTIFVQLKNCPQSQGPARAARRKLEHKRKRGLGSEEEGIFAIGDPTLLVASLLALSVEYQTGCFGIEGHVITRIEIEWPQIKAGVNENR